MSELKPCPFCGGQAKKIRSSGDERDGYADHVSYVCSNCACCRGAVGDSSKGGYADNSKVEALALAAWNTRAAPAEDVRAVGEEPVAWRCGGITWSYRADAVNHAKRFSLAVEPLYRHPQRPVVLPERFDIPHRDEYESTDHHAAAVHEANTWNACLDAVEELNK